MSDLSGLWFVAVPTLYCVIQAARDFRARKYKWAVAAAISAAILLILPLKTNVIKVDLPTSQ